MKLQDILHTDDIAKIKETGSFSLEGRGGVFSAEYVKALVEYVKIEGITLNSLSLTACSITSEAVKALCELRSLKSLDLSENYLVMADINVIADNLIILETLDISQNYQIDEVVKNLLKSRIKKLICGPGEDIQIIKFTDEEQQQMQPPPEIVFSGFDRSHLDPTKKEQPLASMLLPGVKGQPKL